MSAYSFSRMLPAAASAAWTATESPKFHSRKPSTVPPGCFWTEIREPGLSVAELQSKDRITGSRTKLRRSVEESIRLALNASIVCIEIEMSFWVNPRSIQKSRSDCALKPLLLSARRVGRRVSPQPECSPASIEARIPEVENPPNSWTFTRPQYSGSGYVHPKCS